MSQDEILKGAYSAEEFADDIESMRENGLPRGEFAGWSAFDKLYTVPRGQWTVVTGFSGAGKSSWVDNLCVNLAKGSKWKFLICSPENQPIQRHIAGLMEIYTGRKFGKFSLRHNVRDDVFMTDAEHREAYAFVCEHFYFINPPDTDFTVDGIICIAAEVYENHFKFDGMVLDPYNEIEHKRPPGVNETDYIATVIQKFRNFTRQMQIHFWFVAHPTKPVRLAIKFQAQDLIDDKARKPVYQRATLFDISGSSNWKSKCDFGIIVHRDMSDPTTPSTIEVEKVRFREQGDWGEVPMFYDFLCNRFVENFHELL